MSDQSSKTILNLDQWNHDYEVGQNAVVKYDLDHRWDISVHWHFLLIGVVIGLFFALVVMKKRTSSP